MSKKEQLQPIAEPKPIANYSNEQILIGKPVPAIDRIRIMSPTEYEDFISEWIHGCLKTKYAKIGRFSGSGDLGRDIIGYANEEGIWDNYQCKHYSGALAPTEFWVEVGKLSYYTAEGRYSLPRKYYIVAPHGVGPKLGGFLEKSQTFRKEFIEAWDRYCTNEIVAGKKIPLTRALRTHVETIDFGIFEAISPQAVLEEHKTTRWHAIRFGGGLSKARPPAPKPPTDIESSELEYIRQLLGAYEEHTRGAVTDLKTLAKHVELSGHFMRQRENFYEAESLRQFSRDTLPENGKYEELLGQFYAGIVDVVDKDHEDGFKRLQEAVATAHKLQISGHILSSLLKVQDRCGICHQLANEGRVSWVKKK